MTWSVSLLWHSRQIILLYWRAIMEYQQLNRNLKFRCSYSSMVKCELDILVNGELAVAFWVVTDEWFRNFYMYYMENHTICRWNIVHIDMVQFVFESRACTLYQPPKNCNHSYFRLELFICLVWCLNFTLQFHLPWLLSNMNILHYPPLHRLVLVCVCV